MLKRGFVKAAVCRAVLLRVSVKRAWTVYEVRVYNPIVLTIVVLALNKNSKWRVVQDAYNFSSLLVYNNKEQIHIIKFQFVIIVTSLRIDRKKGNDVKPFFSRPVFFFASLSFSKLEYISITAIFSVLWSKSSFTFIILLHLEEEIKKTFEPRVLS